MHGTTLENTQTHSLKTVCYLARPTFQPCTSTFKKAVWRMGWSRFNLPQCNACSPDKSVTGQSELHVAKITEVQQHAVR